MRVPAGSLSADAAALGGAYALCAGAPLEKVCAAAPLALARPLKPETDPDWEETKAASEAAHRAKRQRGSPDSP